VSPVAKLTTAQMARLYQSGLGLRGVAAHAGITQEGVRQRFLRMGIRMRTRTETASAKRRARLLWTLVERLRRAEPCPVCGYWILRVSRGPLTRTCSPECALAWGQGGFRYHVDPHLRKYHNQHQRAHRPPKGTREPWSAERRRKHPRFQQGSRVQQLVAKYRPELLEEGR
jgi:hypothetical protein